jgi:hypothetical protein
LLQRPLTNLHPILIYALSLSVQRHLPGLSAFIYLLLRKYHISLRLSDLRPIFLEHNQDVKQGPGVLEGLRQTSTSGKDNCLAVPYTKREWHQHK